MKKSSVFLCRSQNSVAICNPNDPLMMIIPRRSLDGKYSRIVDSMKMGSGHDHRRPTSVTLAMVTKKENNKNNVRHVKATNVIALPPSHDNAFHVVVMKVSIHCQGCAGKVKKHIAKMEGVTSFTIDVESKRVTVMGHVSPVAVLETISKVKKAEFWPCS